MSGFSLCKELLKIDPQLKFCFLTGFENHAALFEKEYKEFGNDCFLKKPISISALAQTINSRLVKGSSPGAEA